MLSGCTVFDNNDVEFFFCAFVSGKPARSLSSSPSSASLMMGSSSGNKIVSLTPTLSLNQITLNQIQSYITPNGDGGVDVEQSDTSAASTPAHSPRKSKHGGPTAPLELAIGSAPGLWLGSKRSPGTGAFCQKSLILSYGFGAQFGPLIHTIF